MSTTLPGSEWHVPKVAIEGKIPVNRNQRCDSNGQSPQDTGEVLYYTYAAGCFLKIITSLPMANIRSRCDFGVLYKYRNTFSYNDTFSSKPEMEQSVFTFKSNFWTIGELLNKFKRQKRAISLLLSGFTLRSALPYKILEISNKAKQKWDVERYYTQIVPEFSKWHTYRNIFTVIHIG